MINRSFLKGFTGIAVCIPLLCSAICLLWLSNPALASNDITRVSTDSGGNQIWNESAATAISADGRYIAFLATPNNVVYNNDWLNWWWPGTGIFVKDTVSGNIKKASTDSDDVSLSYGRLFAPTISSDGRYVAFCSQSGQVWVKNMETGQLNQASLSSDGRVEIPRFTDPDYLGISADGRYVTFSSDAPYLVPNDTNDRADVFVKDMETGNIVIASKDSAGSQTYVESTSPAISADGRYVAFISSFPSLAPHESSRLGLGNDFFVKDMNTGELRLVSTPQCNIFDGESFSCSFTWTSPSAPSISADGRYISFVSSSPDLVVGDTNGMSDIFVKDMETGSTTRVSTGSYGSEGFGDRALHPSISGDGRYVTFFSGFTNLVPSDNNSKYDVFIKDTITDQTIRISTDATGNEGDADSYFPAFSADGHYVTFISAASNLIVNDTNGTGDVFIRPIDFNCLTCGNLGTGLIPGDIVISADRAPGILGSVAFAGIPGKWKHMGIYVGYGQVVEANMDGASFTNLSSWTDPNVSPNRNWVDYLRVNTDQATRDRAVQFAKDQVDIAWGYNPLYVGRDAAAKPYWYCSEIVWAAYINASNSTVDLADNTLIKTGLLPASWQTYLNSNYLYDFGLPITPTNIYNSSHVYRIGGNNQHEPLVCAFNIVFNCPVDMEVIDPQGRIVNIDTNEIPGATYGRDIDENGEVRSWVGIPERLAGNYHVRAIPWSVAVPEDTYSAEVELEDGSVAPLASETPISAMPEQPYTYVSVSKPVLKLAWDNTKWASYADYTARQLSVNYFVANAGNIAALNTTITSQSITSGVTLSSPTLPYVIGDLPQGETFSFETKVHVPSGVVFFKTYTQAVCIDGSGQTYHFPGTPSA